MSRKQPDNSITSVVWLPYIFCLPVELIIAVAGLMCDKDLHALTQVCHRMAIITCPIFLARQGLTPSSTSPNSLTIRGKAFSGLGVWLRWRRSPAFVPVHTVYCWFNPLWNDAVRELNYFQKGFSSLPTEPTFANIYLYRVPMLPGKESNFLQTALQAGCSKLHIEAHPSILSSPNVSMKKYHPSMTYSTHLKELEFRCQRLSAATWRKLMTSIAIPSVRKLVIQGEVEMEVMRNFLLRHSNIVSLQFTSTSKTPTRFAPSTLTMPNLVILKGTSRHLLSLLRSFLVAPDIRHLNIECDASADLPFHVFSDNVWKCVALCGRPCRWDLTVTIPESINDVNAVSAGRLPSDLSSASVNSLCIRSMHTNNRFILVRVFNSQIWACTYLFIIFRLCARVGCSCCQSWSISMCKSMWGVDLPWDKLLATILHMLSYFGINLPPQRITYTSPSDITTLPTSTIPHHSPLAYLPL